ncbi:MAG: EAL domain-containing protein [Aquihabitans sp.]
MVGFGAYLLAALWAREISLNSPVLIWFPPAAVAMVAMFFRPRLLPVFVVAELVSTPLIMGRGADFGVVPLIVNATGISLAYAAAALVMRRLELDWRLRTSDDILRFTFATLVVGSVAASIVGVGVQVWVGLVDGSEYVRNVALFWVGDVVAAIALGPLLLVLGGIWLHGSPLCLSDRGGPQRWPWTAVEYLSPAVAVAVSMQLADDPMRFTYLGFIPLVMVALRHGLPGAAVSAAGLGAVMVFGAHLQIAGTLERSDLQLQVMVLCLAGLVTGSVVSARRDLLDASERVRAIIDATPDLIGSADTNGEITYLNPVGRRLLGLRDDEAIRGNVADFFPDALALDLLREGMRTADRTGMWSGETHLRRADGSTVPVSQVLVAHRQPGDDSVTYSTICRDTTDRLLLEEQLRHAVLHDKATGLPNRALLTEFVSRAVEDADVGPPTAILFLDVDHLSRVNDTFGFHVGDQVIGQMAERIMLHVRHQDFVARYGGSRFVVVMPEISEEFEAVIVADRLLDAFTQPVVLDGHDVQVTGSVGIAIAEPGQTYAEVLRRSEIAFHRAHEAGGGQFAVFDEEIQRRSQERIQQEVDLRKVLADETWWLAYQPIVDTDRQIIGVEALLRYTDPVRGPVAPYELIRLAEHSGSIFGLGRKIFAQACQQACRWHQQGFDLAVSINVSSLQLRDPNFVDDVAAGIEQSGVDPSKVVVELTETILATNEYGEIASLERLRSLGCTVALDDFGTGYSSLSGLGGLPLDVLKLDQAFVSALGNGGTTAAALVESVVSLAEAFGLAMVAEGVETEEQFATLIDLGCTRFQGFLFSKPLDPSALTELLFRGDRAG